MAVSYRASTASFGYVKALTQTVLASYTPRHDALNDRLLHIMADGTISVFCTQNCYSVSASKQIIMNQLRKRVLMELAGLRVEG